MDERAERAILSHAEAYRLVEEARQMREERDAALAEIDRLATALAAIRHAAGALPRHESGAVFLPPAVAGLILDAGSDRRAAERPECEGRS
jgi:hypothetical protein